MKTVAPWITVYKYAHQSTHQGPLFQVWTWTDAYLSSPSPTPAYFSHAYTRELCIRSCWYCLIVRLLLPHQPPFLQVEIWITTWDSDGLSGQKGPTTSRGKEFCLVYTNCQVPVSYNQMCWDKNQDLISVVGCTCWWRTAFFPCLQYNVNQMSTNKNMVTNNPTFKS